MIKTIQFSCEGKTYLIQYPFTPLMEAVTTEILCKNEYPALSFLQGHQGAVLDIGANIGCASLIFSISYPSATVFAFEPSKDTYKFLLLNTNALPNVRCFNYGLYNRDCCVKLYTGKFASVTGSIGQSMLNSSEFEMVELRRVSSFITYHGLDRILLIKIDTEGSEVPILRDIEPLLDRVESIILEYHSEQDRVEIDQLLASRFTLFSAKASQAHRGNLAYVSKAVLATRTDWDRFAIRRPD